MLPTEIAVTGTGVWSAAGTSPDALLTTAIQGPCPARGWSTPDGPIAVCHAPEPPPSPRFPKAHFGDRVIRLALAAASDAWDSAQLSDTDPTRIAILVGTSRGGSGTQARDRIPSRPRPTSAANTAIASLSGTLSLALGAQGPCLTVSASCTSAANAIRLGALLLQSGEVDVVLAGGAEAPLTESVLSPFLAAGLMIPQSSPSLACRPFDRSRNSIAVGEGAAFLVLEQKQHALLRGREIHAILAGSATASEAYSRVAPRPDGDGLVRTIRQALRQESPGAAEVGYVNAHGTGTKLSDTAEARALATAFADGSPRPAISSTKPITGHTLGAAAAIEAVLTIQTLKAQLAPPTWNHNESDLDCDLDIIHGKPRVLSTRYALSTSMGFWGTTAALLFRRDG